MPPYQLAEVQGKITPEYLYVKQIILAVKRGFLKLALVKIIFMKKLFFLILFLFFPIYYSAGQSFDWNIRGGINIMNDKTPGKDVAVLFHAGAEAGIRIANFGFYGEILYSVHANQYGGDPVMQVTAAVSF